MSDNKKERKFLTLPVTPDEFEKMNRLVVEVTKAKNVPTERTDVMRAAINLKALQVMGIEIFTEAAQ
jgi:hypothetical protein